MRFGSLPTVFPSRSRLLFDPGIADRQLWGLGMIVAQWGMTEMLIHTHVHKIVGGSGTLYESYRAQPTFKHQRQFWETQIKLRLTQDADRAVALGLVSDVKRLKSERDRVIHGAWGGGMQENSWGARGSPDAETVDAQILPAFVNRGTPKWAITFARLRKLGEDLANLNVRLSQIAFD